MAAFGGRTPDAPQGRFIFVAMAFMQRNCLAIGQICYSTLKVFQIGYDFLAHRYLIVLETQDPATARLISFRNHIQAPPEYIPCTRRLGYYIPSCLTFLPLHSKYHLSRNSVNSVGWICSDITSQPSRHHINLVYKLRTSVFVSKKPFILVLPSVSHHSNLIGRLQSLHISESDTCLRHTSFPRQKWSW